VASSNYIEKTPVAVGQAGVAFLAAFKGFEIDSVIIGSFPRRRTESLDPNFYQETV
jgi:hypothetical protein